MKTILRPSLATIIGCLVGLAVSMSQIGVARSEDAGLFETRIRPIADSRRPSSCTECHFAGVDLAQYVAESEAETFANLKQLGWIDVQHPERSKLLTFIGRKPEQEDPLVARVRRQEYEAFRAWITEAVRNEKLVTAQPSDPLPTRLPPEVVRHCRRDRVLRSFVELVWSEMGRCISCHSPDRNGKVVEKHGEQVSWIVPHDPWATLQKLVEQGDIDLLSPEESLLLLKPLGIEEHGGGPKFAPGSRTDKNVRAFLRDYAHVVDGDYRRADQVPAEPDVVAAPTGQHLRIVDLPKELGGKLLRVDLYRWNGSSWSSEPWATADNPINGKRGIWQSAIFAVARRNTRRGQRIRQNLTAPAAEHLVLPAGRYLARIYVDLHDRAQSDRDYLLDASDAYGVVEFQGPWPPGWKRPKVLHAPKKNE